MAKKKVWVVGHKHPDTDSICAAISYANLKNEIEKKNPKTATGMTYIAKRAGSVNAETAYVLERFHAEAPAMISDVRDNRSRYSDTPYRGSKQSYLYEKGMGR